MARHEQTVCGEDLPLTRLLPDVEVTGTRDKIDIDGKIAIPPSIVVDQPIDAGGKR